LPERLIIIRHAHRNKPLGRKADNGLSKKGRKQAKAIAHFFTSRFKDTKPLILSSPKVRCVETVAPLAKAIDAEIIAESSLLEQGDDSKEESLPQFKDRVEKFVKRQLASKSKIVILCSHGDWIPEALHLLTDNDLALDKGGWAEFEVERQHARLIWLLQSYWS
jgi:8-oxo-(d)GTP phosphatase